MYFYINRTVKTFTKLQVKNMKLFEEKTFLYTVFSYLGFLSLILLMHREGSRGRDWNILTTFITTDYYMINLIGLSRVSSIASKILFLPQNNSVEQKFLLL